MNYNLLEEKWIPVLWSDGNTNFVGIIEALERAKAIRCITLASPLDLFAVHRFLLTLLYWKADFVGGVEQVRNSALNGKIPGAVINGIMEGKHCFDLFDKEQPFLQDPSARDEKKKNKGEKSIGSLFSELASGTNIAHFHHGDDENMRLCLPCATLGMLRVVPWSQSGGAGLTPSIHNAPPIMAIATGDNLAITLGLNLVPLDVETGEPKWSGHFKPTTSTKPIPYLEALTWNPRRIHLPTVEEGVCWYCGQSGVPTVGKIVYLKNENTKSKKKNSKSIPFAWKDPSAFYSSDTQYKTVKSFNEVRAARGRDLDFLEREGTEKPAVHDKNPGYEGWLLVVPCTNPANNKTFDHRQLELTGFSSKTIRTLPPAGRPSSRQGLNGWKEPARAYPKGIKLFVQAAVKFLAYTDWVALSNAAYREMHDSPAAFDVLSGLYWGLRNNRLPSRNVAWLILKLMAAVPARARISRPNAKFCPILSLPKRQLDERGRKSPYPISFPRGRRLEAALRGALDSNMRKRHPEPVDWIGLCDGLDQLFD